MQGLGWGEGGAGSVKGGGGGGLGGARRVEGLLGVVWGSTLREGAIWGVTF